MRAPTPLFLPAILAFPLAVLLAVVALAGIAVPATYARETASWTAQGIGQDWVDLLVVAPALCVCAYLALRGSKVYGLLLGGALVYAAYSLVLYAFAMHFNGLFLVYCAGLGLAFYGVVTFVAALANLDARAWFRPGAARRVAGAFSTVLGILFYVLWLSEVIPALAAGSAPQSLAEVGLITNPVHILDIGIVLPAFIAGGVALWRERPTGFWLVPVMLAFGVLMDLALFGMAISMAARGVGAGSPPAALFAVMSGVTAVVLAAFLRHLRRPVSGIPLGSST